VVAVEEVVRSGDEVAVAVIDSDLDGSGVRRAERVMRNLGTALAHTVVVDATRVRHVGARGLLLLDHWVHQWQALNLKVKVLASHQAARAIGAAGGPHVVHVTYATPPDEDAKIPDES
jgi:hypothetical protein